MPHFSVFSASCVTHQDLLLRSNDINRNTPQKPQSPIMLQKNDRISVRGSRGTVRYVGKVHVWPDSDAYGVEWDDLDRGKNDGSVGAVRYFCCPDGSGSFLKISNNAIEPSRLVLDALEHRYASQENASVLEENLTIGTKQVERIGFSKLNDITNDYRNFSVLMLDCQCILTVGELTTFPNLEDLDLSYNLLTLWSDIDAILQHTPKLKTLNLNGNRFSQGFWRYFPSTLTHVSLCDTKVQPADLPCFESTNITVLEFAGNGWSEELLLDWKVPSTLRSLNLLGCNFESIPLILRDTQVEELIINDNKIKELRQKCFFSKIKSLDIRHNLFESLSLIDLISVVFPNLSLLRLNHCPAVAGLLDEEMTMELIGRLNCSSSSVLIGILKLNGSILQPEETTNGEMYMVSKIKQKLVELVNPARMLLLQGKYGIRDVAEVPFENDKTIVLGFYRLNEKEEVRNKKRDEREEVVLVRKFMQNNSVLRLKGIVSKVVGKSVLHFELFYYLYNDNSSLKRYLDDNIAVLLSLGFIPNQRIYIEM